MDLLNQIQKVLKVPKSHRNSFANYDYRNAEDILEAVKPLLGDGTLTLSDEIVMLGDRFYVKATATLCNGESNAAKRENVSATGYAREPLDKRGSDASQITGAASSYARKYALNGLFCIDDTKDADDENVGPNSHHKDDVPILKPGVKTLTLHTGAVAAPAPRKLTPPAIVKSIEQQRLAYEARIKQLIDEIEMIPFATEEEYAREVAKHTALEFKPENYLAIGILLAEIAVNQNGK